MNAVRSNILANLAGNTVTALSTVIWAPVYISLLGIESYGLIGVYMTLQTLSIFLDMGLSTTINREISILAATGDRAREMRDLVRTLETVYWISGVVIACGIYLLAPVIAHRWLHFERLSPSVGEQAIRIAALAIGLRWPLTLYSGALMGLQRQVLLNGISSIAITLQSAGAACVLWFLTPTIEAFLWWQVLSGAVQVLIARLYMLASLPKAAGETRFEPAILRSLWRFSAGAGVFTITSMLLNQVDKVILSKQMSLETFGYYNLASVAAGAIYRLVGPVFAALFPRFASLLGKHNIDQLTETYHSGCQLVSVLLAPTALVGVVFAERILVAWTGSIRTASSTHIVMSLLVAGSAMNALIYVPYALQLASGWTRLGNYMNVLGLLVAAALLPTATARGGAVGAAAVKLMVNCVIFVISPYLMHRKLLRGEKGRWYVDDIAIPFAAAAVCCALATLITVNNSSRWSSILFLATLFAATLLVSGLSSGRTRVAAARLLQKARLTL